MFTDRLEQALLLESANMLAADRVSGRGELPEAVLAEERSGSAHRTNPLFHLNDFSDSGNLLVAAKAVTDSYPLRGEVIITEGIHQERPSSMDRHRVKWAGQALPALDIEVGDSVFVGEQRSLSVRSS